MRIDFNRAPTVDEVRKFFRRLERGDEDTSRLLLMASLMLEHGVIPDGTERILSDLVISGVMTEGGVIDLSHPIVQVVFDGEP